MILTPTKSARATIRTPEPNNRFQMELISHSPHPQPHPTTPCVSCPTLQPTPEITSVSPRGAVRRGVYSEAVVWLEMQSSGASVPFRNQTPIQTPTLQLTTRLKNNRSHAVSSKRNHRSLGEGERDSKQKPRAADRLGQPALVGDTTSCDATKP